MSTVENEPCRRCNGIGTLRIVPAKVPHFSDITLYWFECPNCLAIDRFFEPRTDSNEVSTPSSPYKRPLIKSSNDSPSPKSPSETQIRNLQTKLEAAAKVAQDCTRRQQACLLREGLLQEKLDMERRRAQALVADRELLLKQKADMLAAAQDIQAHVLRWQAKEKEYKAQLEIKDTQIKQYQALTQEQLLQLDALHDEVMQYRASK
eukprot:Blabericola_migrator_1__8475@NODE_441_length_8449_cov_49_535552_g346_i0_p7_GENE_NODE_441_length_8449_cov_49_535552_g346_i0NODE_441_length_8449_cov_49_535552_g346_i0_p7_ORF_typecomplete_len206_score36_32zfZPR1/PF03367_13/6e05zfZPR1/PF03367_13/3_1e03zfZPR1/PF03367_13/1_9e03DUF737/PF05300_11/0_017DUF536/PF04394_14/3_6e02DUF536/PF04394_14/3_8AAA_13/PF13166_6/2_3DUF3498/PF12004_8/19_NODE_441_length_8449_cov_49_535552_g346_i064377054